jgi:hypothetical protein
LWRNICFSRWTSSLGLWSTQASYMHFTPPRHPLRIFEKKKKGWWDVTCFERRLFNLHPYLRLPSPCLFHIICICWHKPGVGASLRCTMDIENTVRVLTRACPDNLGVTTPYHPDTRELTPGQYSRYP